VLSAEAVARVEIAAETRRRSGSEKRNSGASS